MIELIDFTHDEFELFKSWISNEAEMVQFAGPQFEYPITNDQLSKYLNIIEQQSKLIRLKENNQIIGHCELNFKNDIPRLSRILIGDKGLRGKGIGQQIVAAMVKIIFENKLISVVDLNVFEWNMQAVKCYEKIGFRIVKENTTKTIVGKEVWTKLNMQLHREEWKQLNN